VRVAITRPRERAAETEAIIRKKGWDPVVVSSIEIVALPIDPSVSLNDFDWLVVTSASGVDLLWNRFKDALKEINIAVVGPKTSVAFGKKGISPKVVASESVGEGLAKDLLERVSGRRVLVARAKKGRKELVDMLSKVADVTEITLYDTVFPADKTGMERFKALLSAGEIDAIIFTSSLSAKHLLDFIGEDGGTRLSEIIVCAIGPVTALTLEELGITPTCIPELYTIDSALDEISRQK
jgi:uroporphyrinogen-III synthase